MDKEYSEKEALQDARGEINRLYGTIQTLNSDISFWKRLALSELGVDTAKINDLVHNYNSVGGNVGQSTLGRKY